MLHPALLILCSNALAQPGGTGGKAKAIHSLRSGKPRLALEAARALIEADPDDPDGFALLGAALSRVGDFGGALAAFELAIGSPLYEADGIGPHADTLRAFGRGREAAELRLQRPLVVPSSKAELLAYEGAIDDLRSARDTEAALDLALEATGMWPQSSLMHAVLADVLTDRGDTGLGNTGLGNTDEAAFQLWLADLYDASPLRVELARARRALAEDNLVDAEAIADRVMRLSKRDPSALALRAEVSRREGAPDDAMAYLERRTAGLSDHPDYLAVRILVLTDLGRTEEARAEAARWRSVYPLDSGLQQAEAYALP